MNESLVEIQDLTKIFSSKHPPALQNIQAKIPKGQIVGVVGPDGAGKTTLIRLIAGLLLPSSGKITVAGNDSVKQAEEIHCLTGYMPQKFGLYEDLTVEQNLNLYADIRGLSKDERQATFEQLLHFTALKPFTQRLARNLSGGMKQKLGLACALLKTPALLLLDEPTVGIDPISRRELWKMVSQLLDQGISVIWSTAYLDEAQKCPTVILLSEGKMVFQGKPELLMKRVEGRVVKITNIQRNKRELLSQLLQDSNVMDGVIQGKDLRLVLREKKTVFYAAEAVEPRFEDGFVDILGGGPGGQSKLADRVPPVISTVRNMIHAEKLTKKFGNFTAVNEVSFDISRGEVFGLLGPNGAGKSTIFKMLCGLLKPSSGQTMVAGIDLQMNPGEASAQIGYMAQKFSLYGGLSVYQNLEFFAGIYNLTGKEKRKAIHEMIEIFYLKPYLSDGADSLPLGFKQRLALACANMHHPNILFLDEPTSGVDPVTRREFWNHINGLVERGVTIMVTTHFMDEAEYCDRIALIYRGKIINIQTPDMLKDIAKTSQNPKPTLEDAFVQLIEEYDAAHPL